MKRKATLILSHAAVLALGLLFATAHAEKRFYDKGYRAGQDSCSEPSRLEVGAAAVTRFLSRPADGK